MFIQQLTEKREKVPTLRYNPYFSHTFQSRSFRTYNSASMTKRTAALGMILLTALFLLVNRASYHGYFQDDELDTLSWAPRADPSGYLKAVVTPRFLANNFRPVGHFYFHEAGRLFGLDFPKYMAILQLIHVINFWLLWAVAQRLRAPPLAALLGCVFFAFHMALFDAFWKPMYVYDVLCGTFCLLSLLFWTQRRWVLSFAAFWLAYKAKELAVMLPAVLACYEIWLGERRWKPLVPFFLASLSFGLQGLALNPNKDNDYTFRFTLPALLKTSTYYAGRIFLVPYLGFLAVLAAIPGRNRRTWFGLAMAFLLFFPLLFLPGRIFSAYCYVPFTGLALALSGLAEAVGPVPVAVFLVLFAPLALHELRARRNVTLARDNQIRGWVTAVLDFAKTAPPIDAVVWNGRIPNFGDWGEEGALYYAFHKPDLKIAYADDPAAADLLEHARVAYVAWNPALNRATLAVHGPGIADLPYINFSTAAPVWQLEQGWLDAEADYHWTRSVAFARLTRPAGATHFAMRVLVGPERLQAAGQVTVRVWLNQKELEPRHFASSGWQEAHWDIAAEAPGPVRVKLEADPPFAPPGGGAALGIAVGAFGFVSEDWRPRQ